jgi:hypothetical protein
MGYEKEYSRIAGNSPSLLKSPIVELYEEEKHHTIPYHDPDSHPLLAASYGASHLLELSGLVFQQADPIRCDISPTPHKNASLITSQSIPFFAR